MAVTAKRHINTTIYVLALVLACIGKIYHELWLDEWHVLAIVRESNSLSQLWHNKACDGHPILYYLIFYLFKGIQNQKIVSIIVHLLFVAWLYYLICFKSPFAWYVKLLCTLSIIFMYEYSVLNRPYALLAALIFYGSHLAQQQKLNIVNTALLITAMSQLTVYGAVFSGALALLLLYTNNKTRNLSSITILAIIYITNLILLYKSIDLPPDSMTHYLKPERGPNTWHLSNIVTYFQTGFFSMLRFNDASWNTALLMRYSYSVVLALCIMLYALLIIKPWQGKIFFLICMLGMFILNLEADLKNLRHLSFYFVSLMSALWIFNPQKDFTIFKVKVNSSVLLLPMLLSQAFWGIYLYRLDIKLKFTEAVENIVFLKREKLYHLPRAGYGDASITATAMYDNTAMYNLRTNELAYTSKWDTLRSQGPGDDTLNVLRQLYQLHQQHDSIILIASENGMSKKNLQQLDSISKLDTSTILKLAYFDMAIVPMEKYHLYLSTSKPKK